MQLQNIKLRKGLETLVNSLDNDIKKLRKDDSVNKIKNLLNESDANLIEEIKFELIDLLRIKH